MISQRAREITERIYTLYGSDSGMLFGIPPYLKDAVVAVVECTLDHIESEENDYDKGSKTG